MKFTYLTFTGLALSLTSVSAFSKVTPEEANKLGTELTLFGAEKQGNASGTIPAYEGGLNEDEGRNPLDNRFPEDKPLFVITKDNMSRYKNHLTSGQIALFEKYPDTYRMPVYQTRRTAAYSDKHYDKVKNNATSAELVDGGNGVSNFDELVPFPIPKSGLEVIWNHVSRYRGGSVERNVARLPVQRSGAFTPIKIRAQYTAPQYLEDGYDEQVDKNILFYYRSAIKAPARLTGNVLLVHETIDQIEQPRLAWSYNAGQRRVRRAPQTAYDAPSQASDGLATVDQTDMFNGAPDKYDWKLIGKKEIYIPYNSYKLADQKLKYEDIIQQGHINQDLARYELHRVWKIEATLKEDERHLYGKRTYYIDEDSWQISLADHYDNRGVLWRMSEGHPIQFVDINALWYVTIANYDLLSGRYLAELSNEEDKPFNFEKSVNRQSFTAAAIRRAGKR